MQPGSYNCLHCYNKSNFIDFLTKVVCSLSPFMLKCSSLQDAITYVYDKNSCAGSGSKEYLRDIIF